MTKTSSLTIKICDLVSKNAIYLLVFLLPLFFLSWTANVLDFNKQALLILLSLISLFSLMIKVLIEGKIVFNISKIHIGIGVLFLIYLVSTIFSLWFYGSFWGWPLSSNDCLLSLMFFSLLYFLITTIFKKKDVVYLIYFLVISGFLALVFGFFQIFGKFLFPFAFTRTSSFNTLGSFTALSIFCSILVVLSIIFLMKTKKIWRVFFLVCLFLCLGFLIIVNFPIGWWLVGAGSFLIIVLGAQKRDFFDNRWLVLPMFFLALALFFGFFNIRLINISTLPQEAYLNQKASFEIAWQVLKERPLFGSGPGTFVYDFSKFKNAGFNNSIFWSVRFRAAGSKLLNILTTEGALGLFIFLGLVGLFVFYGVKFLFKKTSKKEESQQIKEEKRDFWLTGCGIFVSFIVLVVGYCLYSSVLVLDFIFFLLVAAFVVLFPEKQKKVVLEPSSVLSFGATFIFTVVFVFSLGLLFLQGKRYFAEVRYYQGIVAWQKGNVQEARNFIESALRVNPSSDLYWRETAQIYLVEVQQESRKDATPVEEKTKKVQFFLKNAVNYAKKATEVNPRNVANWAVRGFINQSLIGIVPGIEKWAVDAYNKAIELEPVNPYLITQRGVCYLKTANLEKEEDRKKNISLAKGDFKKAIDLKPNYVPARFHLATTLQSEGKIQEAIKEMEEARRLAYSDAGVAFQLGLLYYQAKEYKKAQSEFERAVSINPNYSNAFYFLGLLYDKQGEKSKAISAFEKVAKLNPDNKKVEGILENLKSGKGALEGIGEAGFPEALREEVKPEEKIKPEGEE